MKLPHVQVRKQQLSTSPTSTSPVGTNNNRSFNTAVEDSVDGREDDTKNPVRSMLGLQFAIHFMYITIVTSISTSSLFCIYITLFGTLNLPMRFRERQITLVNHVKFSDSFPCQLESHITKTDILAPLMTATFFT